MLRSFLNIQEMILHTAKIQSREQYYMGRIEKSHYVSSGIPQ